MSGTIAPIGEMTATGQQNAAIRPSVTTKEEPATGSVNAATAGAWSPVRAWPLIAIHAALLGDGRVMTFGTNPDGKQTGSFWYDVWDSTAARADQGHLTLPNTTGTDLFCSTQTVLPGTGELLIGGGDVLRSGNTTNTANDHSTLFDPLTNSLRDGARMSRPRWYASVTTLPDGRSYLQGGTSGTDFPEVRGTSGSFSLLGSAATGSLDYWYPRNFVAPDGRLFGFDVAGRVYYADASGSGYIDRRDNIAPALMGHTSSAALFEPQRVLQISGTTNRVAVVDFSGPLPTATETSPVSSVRQWVSATVLADGSVLATGGSRTANALVGVNNTAEIWNPATGVWRVGAAGSLARLYHSTALLLPDASVLVAGGGAPGPLINTNAEIYFPPYLFNAEGAFAARPLITSAPALLDPGQTFSVSVDDGAMIASAALIRTGSVTHSVNFDQRRIPMPIQRSGNVLNMKVPRSGAVVPPGNYLLFVISTSGVPSVAKIVRVANGAAADVGADWSGRIGGTGGTEFKLECGAGEVLAGIEGSAAATVQKVVPRCVAVTPSGQWSGLPAAKAVSAGTAGVGSTSYVRDCATNSAVVGFSGRSNTAVDRITLSCRPLVTSGRVGTVATSLAAIGGGGGTARDLRNCGLSHPAYALYGRAANSIDAFGLLCRGDASDTSTNRPPEITSPGNQSGLVGAAVSLPIIASDPDGQALSFSAVGLPAGLSINASTGRVSGVPTSVGVSTVSVTVTDGVLGGAIAFSWTMTQPANLPPVVQSPGSRSGTVGVPLSFAIVASDPESQPLTYGVTALPTGLAINPQSGLIFGTPTQAGNFSPQVTVSDGQNSVGLTFSLQIAAPVNRPPVLQSPGAQLNVVGEDILLSLVGSDPDADALSFSASNLPPGMAINPLNGLISGSPTTVGTRTVVLSVSDGASSASVSIGWSIQASIPVPPPSNCNRLVNPGFESGLGGWEVHTPVSLSPLSHSGARAASFGDGWIGNRIAAGPARQYIATGAYRSAGAAGWAGVGIDYLDANGVEIAETTASLDPVADWATFALTASTPAGTAGIRVWFYADDGRTVSVDDVDLREVGCGEPQAPPPGVCNRLVNPGFETGGLAGWEKQATTTLVPGARSGAAAAQLTAGWIGSRIPAAPGKRYVATGYQQSAGASGWAGVGIDFLDAAGREISEENATLDAAAGWTAFRLAVTAPAATQSIRVWFYAESGRLLSIDDIDLREEGCGEPPTPPVGVCNRLVNPGFELGDGNAWAGWELHAAAEVVAPARSGATAIGFGEGWVGSRIPGVAGRSYTAAVLSKAGGTAGWVGIGIDWLDANGVEIGETNASIDNTISWTRHTVSGTAPAGTAGVRLWVYSQAGRTVQFDDADLRESACTLN